MRSLKIAFTFERLNDWTAQDLSEEDCVEFNPDTAISAIEDALKSIGHTVDVVGDIIALTKRLGAAEAPDWDLVFNTCEGWHGGAGREAQAPALLEAYGVLRYTIL